MVLVTIDSYRGSLPTASWPSNICVAIFLFFSLPCVCDYNSDKSRYHSIGIGTSASVNSFQQRFSSVEHWCFHWVFFLFLLFFFCFIFLFNNCHRDYKSDPLIRCQIQNVVYQLQVTKTNSNVQKQTFALRPEIICKHNVSRGRSVWIIYDLFTTFPSLKMSDT